MQLSTFVAFARSGQLGALFAAQRLMTSFQRFTFLGAASSCGLLARLAQGPVSFGVLAQELAGDAAFEDALRDWLEVGVGVKELRRQGDSYELAGSLARVLAQPKHDALAAFVEESVGLHHRLLWEMPRLAKARRKLTLADQDGGVVARSSRIIEPFVFEAVDDFVPADGAPRLLEIGCGSGVYVRRAAQRNAQLSATALELQPEVAAQASKNLAEWGLSHRAVVEAADVRSKAPAAVFDLATLHNNVYYFAVEERVTLLSHVRRFLVPGGRLLLTTGCRGGSPTMAILSLWGGVTERCGPLPTPKELEGQLREAGFGAVASRQLMPGEQYFAFVATNP